MQEFGNIAGKIAWVIALAAISGAAMMESGAAERIVNWLIQMSGFTEKETLQTWTVMFGILSLAGLAQVLVLSWMFPFR